MRPIPVVRAVALAMAVVSGTLAVLLAGPAVARAATLTIEIQTGAGTITANQGAIECTRQASDDAPPACDFMVGATDKITLLAKPAPDQQFFRWGDLNCGRQPTCQVDMAGMSQTIAAGFAGSRTLDVLAVGDGTVTLSRPAIDLARDDFAATSDCPRSAENPSPDDTNVAGCLFAFLPGTTVTLRAAATDVGTTSFARWSPFDCSGTGPCKAADVGRRPRRDLPTAPPGGAHGRPRGAPQGMLDRRGLRKTMSPAQLRALARGERHHRRRRSALCGGGDGRAGVLR